MTVDQPTPTPKMDPELVQQLTRADLMATRAALSLVLDILEQKNILKKWPIAVQLRELAEFETKAAFADKENAEAHGMMASALIRLARGISPETPAPSRPALKLVTDDLS